MKMVVQMISVLVDRKTGSMFKVWTKAKALWLFAVSFALIIWSPAASAYELPRAEEGYLYYCAGQRADGRPNKPNAIIVLKLRKDNVRDETRAMVWCQSETIDLNFIKDRFFKPNDEIIKGAINFSVSIEVEGREVVVEVGSGGGRDFEEYGKDDNLHSSRQGCGVEEFTDDFGLYVVKKNKKHIACTINDFSAYGLIGNNMDVVKISCGSEDGGNCLFTYHFREWVFTARLIQKSFLLKNWRIFRQKLVDEVEKRVVVYVAPDGCIGPFACDDFE